VTIRAICPEDEPLMARFHQTLSPESVYTRYFNAMKLSRRTTHERLSHVCHPDPTETVLVAEDEPDGERRIIGVGRLSELSEQNAAEVALIVSDAFQGRGIGTELLRRLVANARERHVTRLYAHILPQNVTMQRLCAEAGMQLMDKPGAGEVTAELEL
jgi:acetyltransferase